VDREEACRLPEWERRTSWSGQLTAIGWFPINIQAGRGADSMTMIRMICQS